MHLRLLNSLRAGLGGSFSRRLNMRRLHNLFELKELEDLGLYPAELHILAARGRRLRAAELYAARRTPPRPAAPLPHESAPPLR